MTVVPTFEKFVYWYNQFKSKKCTKQDARREVGFKHTTWHYLCHDYENGADVSKYFKGGVDNAER